MELDNIQGEDTKATRLVDDVHQALSGMYDSVVVFTQYATRCSTSASGC